MTGESGSREREESEELLKKEELREETTAREQTTLAGDLYIHVFMVRYDHAQTFLSLIPMIT